MDNLEKTKEVIMNGQSRETGNIGYTRRRYKTKHQTIYVGHHHTQTDTNKK